MKYLVFSDIHGNLPALESVLKSEKDVDGYINLGDVVNYGPWSNECVQLIETLDNCYNIVGNHEDYFLMGSCPIENPLVQSFFAMTYPSFDNTVRIKKYKKSINLNGFSLIHTIGEKNYIFKDTVVQLEENYLIGHSHQQYLRYINGYLLINPGSIGQNRAHINLSNFIIWDTDSGEFEMKNSKYNLDHLLKEMVLKEYPDECINYYKNKKQV